MSAAIPDTQAFIATVDRFAEGFGLPLYSDLVRLVRQLEGRASDLHAGLVLATSHAAAAEVCLLLHGEGLVEHAQDQAGRARAAGNAAITAAERRADVAGRPDVAVLAVHRARLRAGGRRA